METLIIITNLILLLGDKDAELNCSHLVCNLASQNMLPAYDMVCTWLKLVTADDIQPLQQ